MGKGQDLYKKAKTMIPGGTQLLTKRPEMHLPENWPSYYKSAKGCEVTDLDGKKYEDFSFMGVGSCILGYADPDVNKAVKQVVDSGNMCTLNGPEEVELTEMLCKIHPWAHMARYARSGGEAMSIAIRIARAYSRNDKILFCGYHGWHDWYLASNLANDSSLDGHLIKGLEPNGVPRGLKGTAIPFQYNDTQGFIKAFNKHKNELACIVMEPVRYQQPASQFLETVRALTKENDIPLIFDEITSAFRVTCGGIHLKHNVAPDIAVFAKGMSNGYPMGAIIGTKQVMQAAQTSFISSTYWTERIGPAAALATIHKVIKEQAIDHLSTSGQLIKNGWSSLAEKHGIDITVEGLNPLCHFSFNYDKPLALKTLFTQEMLKKGYLATTAYYATFAHSTQKVSGYLKAVDEVFGKMKAALNDPESLLEGPVCHSGFQRLT